VGTRTYRYDGLQRAINRCYRRLTLLGLGARHRHLLTVTGRRSGRPITTPVDVMTVAGEQWLVAPYGEVQWVRNLRVTPTLTLQRGRSTRRFTAVEVDHDAAVPVIRTYIRTVPVTRGYWGVTADATTAELTHEAVTHPVFRLVGVG
jgi:deazaflavin-dependent oxidoreductase (nitroreductase family)